MLCFLLLRLGSMSASTGRGRQHAFLKREAQGTFVALPRARRIECDLFCCAAYVRLWHKADIALMPTNVRFEG